MRRGSGPGIGGWWWTGSKTEQSRRQTTSAANTTALPVLRHPWRRQARASIWVEGPSGRGNQRRLGPETLSPKATQAISRRPVENLESKTPASAKANPTTVERRGERHISAKVQTARTEKKVTAISVSTSGPKARNTGAETSTARQRRPPRTSAKREAHQYSRRPKPRVRRSMGPRAQVTARKGSSQRVMTEWPKAHSPRTLLNPVSLKVQAGSV